MRFEDVTFENGDTRLAGMLVLPESEGTYPAIALVEGSGNGVRKDPYFLALADLFVNAGFAVPQAKPSQQSTTCNLARISNQAQSASGASARVVG
jgi:hypothetical protein